ncbi:MAG: helix-turn-helix domain-containing protein [Oscillospiraceae bacterium]|nr:helix-turn-helix domain-containing protein [Oscillospiraceae bacterium]
MKDFTACEPIVSQIRTCCFVPPGTGTLVHRSRPSHGLALHLSGETLYCFDNGQKVCVRASDLIYLPKNSNYQVVTDTRGDCWAINFYLADDEDYAPFMIHCGNSAPYIEAFEQAVRHWRRKSEGYQMKCFSCLYQILYLLRRDYILDHSVNPKQAILAPALKYIQNNYTQQSIRVEALAQACGISQVYLRRLFNEVYGTSPIKYINARRLDLAKELLTSQLYSIRDLAALTGYSDESVFSREFKKATGLSPRSYLARQRSVSSP